MGFQTYIFCSKCRKCRFRDPNFKTFPGGHAPGPPYNCVVTMVSPSLKSWLRHWAYYMPSACNYSGKIAGKLLRKLSGKLQFGYGVDYTIKDISFPTPKLYSFSILENLMSLDLHWRTNFPLVIYAKGKNAAVNLEQRNNIWYWRCNVLEIVFGWSNTPRGVC